MRFVETPVFTTRVARHLPDDEYRALQLALLLRPEQGALIPGGGGIRKLRSSRAGGIQMKDVAFQELLTSVRQAGQIRRGRLKPGRVTAFKPADVKAVRAELGQSQEEFALMIGVSVATLRNWEQGRRTPDGPALALLKVAARNPKAVAEALHRPTKRGAA